MNKLKIDTSENNYDEKNPDGTWKNEELNNPFRRLEIFYNKRFELQSHIINLQKAISDSKKELEKVETNLNSTMESVLQKINIH